MSVYDCPITEFMKIPYLYNICEYVTNAYDNPITVVIKKSLFTCEYIYKNLLLSEFLMPYNNIKNVLSTSLNKTFPSS